MRQRVHPAGSKIRLAVLTALALAVLGTEVKADFSGDYAAGNFTLANSANANGSVDLTNAPASLSITGGNTGVIRPPGDTTFTITAAQTVRVAFDWNYLTLDKDGPAYDPFGYVQNGIFVQVSSNTGNPQSGSTVFSISFGQVMGFQVHTNDNLEGSSTTTISNFLVSDKVFWKGNASNNWSAVNWTLDSGGTVATSTPDATSNVVFSASVAGNRSTILGADIAIKSLTLSDANNVSIGGPNTLTVSGSSGTTGINVESGAGLLTLASNLTLAGASQEISVNNTAGAIISGAVSGSVGLRKTGLGTLTLGGTNTYTTGTTISAGTVVVGSGTTGNLGSGPVVNNGSLAFNRSNALTEADSISGVGSVSQIGSGITSLAGNNTYSGATSIGNGTLAVNGGHVVSTGVAGSYSVENGGTLGGSGSVDLSAVNLGVIVKSGGHLAPGATIGTLTLRLGTGVLDITGAVGSTNLGALVFELGGVLASDKISLASGTLDIGVGLLDFGDFAFTNFPGFGDGVYTLFDTNSAITGSLGSSLGGIVGGKFVTVSLSENSEDVLLTVSSVPEPSTWATYFVLGALGFACAVNRRLARA